MLRFTSYESIIAYEQAISGKSKAEYEGNYFVYNIYSSFGIHTKMVSITIDIKRENPVTSSIS